MQEKKNRLHEKEKHDREEALVYVKELKIGNSVPRYTQYYCKVPFS